MKGQKTGGRKKGTPNKRTAAREAATQRVAEQISVAVPGAFEGDAHAFLMAVYKNPEFSLKERLAAATGAISFEKPRLQATELSGAVGLTQEQALAEMEKAEADMNGHEHAH